MYESEDSFQALDLIDDPLVSVTLEVQGHLRRLISADHPYDDPLPDNVDENFDPAIRRQFAAIVSRVMTAKQNGLDLDLSEVFTPVMPRKSAVAVEYVGDHRKFLDSLESDRTKLAGFLRKKAVLLRGVDWTPPAALLPSGWETVDRQGLLPFHTDGMDVPRSSILALHCSADVDPGSWLTGLATFEPCLSVNHALFQPSVSGYIDLFKNFSVHRGFGSILSAAKAAESAKDEAKLLEVLGHTAGLTDVILKDPERMVGFQAESLRLLKSYYGRNAPPVYLHAWQPGDLLLISHWFFHGRFASGKLVETDGTLLRAII